MRLNCYLLLIRTTWTKYWIKAPVPGKQSDFWLYFYCDVSFTQKPFQLIQSGKPLTDMSRFLWGREQAYVTDTRENPPVNSARKTGDGIDRNFARLTPQGVLKSQLIPVWSIHPLQYSIPSFKELFALRRIQVEDEPRKRCHLTHPYNSTFGLTHSILFYVTYLLNQTPNTFKRFIYKI